MQGSSKKLDRMCHSKTPIEYLEAHTWLNTPPAQKCAHIMCIVPDSTLDPAKYVRVKNSWGKDTGIDGTFVMRTDLLRMDSDFVMYSLDGAEERRGFTVMEWSFL